MALGDDVSSAVQTLDPGANSNGQGIGDFLSSLATGRPINRRALNMLPVQAAIQANDTQAQAQLRGAQTQQALAAAANAQTEALAGQQKDEARENFKQSLVNNGHSADEADLLSNLAVGGLGDAFHAGTQGIGDLQSQKWKAILADPSSSQQDKFNASQALKGEVQNPLMAAPTEGVNVSGAPVAVSTTPMGAADINAKNAAAAESLAKANAANAAQSTLTPTDLSYYGHIFRLTGQMPSLGMGGSSTRQAIMHAASLEAQGVTNAPDAGYKPQLAAPLVPFTGTNDQAPGAGATPAAGAPPAAGASPTTAGDQSIQNAQNNKVTQQTLSEFGPRGVSGKQVRAINNLSGHLHTVDDLITALNNNDPQAVNKVANTWQQQFGTSAAPTNLELAGPLIGREVVKMLVQNGVGTGQEAQDIANAFDNAHTTVALRGAAQTLRQFRDRQVLGLEQSYKSGTMDGINPNGRTDFRQKYLMPDVQAEVGQNSPDSHITMTPGEPQAVSAAGTVMVVRNGAWVDTGTKAQ
jgi:hypothetical protein